MELGYIRRFTDRPIKYGVLKEVRRRDLLHVRQPGTPETMCGRPFRFPVEVPDHAEVRVCVVCTRRITALKRHLMLPLS